MPTVSRKMVIIPDTQREKQMTEWQGNKEASQGEAVIRSHGVKVYCRGVFWNPGVHRFVVLMTPPNGLHDSTVFVQ